MQIESVRALKEEIRATILSTMLSEPMERQALGIRTQRLNAQIVPRTFALGISKSGNDQQSFQLAVRVQHSPLLRSRLIGRIRDKAKGELDIQFVGSIRPLQLPWYQQRCRPVKIGCSIGHYRVTAGSVGAFVKDQINGRLLALSNNHVLADENRATQGDDILQPGAYDGGQDPADTVASLERSVPIDFQQSNAVDCAVALVAPAVATDSNSLNGLGRLRGLRNDPLTGNEAVKMIGRTTGNTTGTISTIELDNITVDYDQGQATFHSQIEIQGTPTVSFSEGGDSGSLILDDQLAALGLLFAGSSTGGLGNLGYTYANPLEEVLTQLRVDLVS
jgi:hypothetical protein